VLYAMASRIAARITPDESLALNVSAVDLVCAGLIVLGVYFVILGLREASTAVITLAMKPRWDETGSFEYVWSTRREAMARGVIGIAAGSAVAALNRPSLCSSQE
jgi:hypothetical protein